MPLKPVTTTGFSLILTMYTNLFKPLLDKMIALALLLILWPLLLITALLLVMANRGTPFFFQKRPGLHGRIFKIIKFKTMTDEKNASGNLLPDDKRITTVGKWVRRLSLDELPQLINVIKGDMSIIGPRPLLPEYLSIYNEEQNKRHLVKPGITGWAQVNGRNAISWTKKFELDVWYVNNISCMLDCRIFLLTIKKVLIREGISQEGMATIESFNGNN